MTHQKLNALEVQTHENGWLLGTSIFVSKEPVNALPQQLAAVTNVVAYRGTVSKYVVNSTNNIVTCVGCKPGQLPVGRGGVTEICENTPPYGADARLPDSTTTIFVDTTTLADTTHYGNAGAATAAAGSSVSADHGLWLFEVDEIAAASSDKTVAFGRHPEGKRYFFFPVVGKR
ncbi:MAG TPA: hypothetical protein VH143_22425 [Kofleriaceae bacterium]|jgi:hypothetical protein|nr:hypothetical protein [Kofleriaceae bacterium]